MPKNVEKWISLKDWQEEMKSRRQEEMESHRQEEMESRRNEVLIAIRVLAKILLSGEDLKQHRIGEKLAGIGTAITEFGITDEMICQVVAEVHQEVEVRGDRDEDREEIFRHFSNIVPYVGTTSHEIDTSPELGALREKCAAHVVGGHALAKKACGC